MNNKEIVEKALKEQLVWRVNIDNMLLSDGLAELTNRYLKLEIQVLELTLAIKELVERINAYSC